MSEIKIHINNVSKSYKKYKSEFYRFLSWFGVKASVIEQSNVLNHVNFTISEGEAVGIVGENGAGKSTLLKIITGTVQPTSGNVAVNGRVSAILELGLGFNPEMTGRQNVYLSAGVMGFRETEIDGLVDSILCFSELGDYFDQPVRTYSSGMQMRLAFSIATAKRPEILIVDEALSVGDTYFQHKSFNRIREFRKQGCTLLFVSHDRNAVLALCDRAILLENGFVLKDGKPEAVLDYYNALLSKKNEQTIVQTEVDGNVTTGYGTKEATFQSIKLFNSKGVETDTIRVGEEIKVEFIVEVHEEIKSLVLGCGITDRLGQMIIGSNGWYENSVLSNPVKGQAYTFEVYLNANFGIGSYKIHCSLVETDNHIDANYEWIDNAYIFNVVNLDQNKFVGLMWTPMSFEINGNNSLISNQQENSSQRDIVIVDVGCRWGFAKRFLSEIEKYRLYGFDPDKEECQRLSLLSPNNRISFIPVALFDSEGEGLLHITREPACSSLYEPDADLIDKCPELECARKVGEELIQLTTLNKWGNGQGLGNIDYLKIDTQGTELNVLKGASNYLKSIRVIEVEVEFNAIYKDQPLFADVDSFLRSHGFVLWKFTNLVHYGQSGESENEQGNMLVCHDKKWEQLKSFGGQLHWADAHYVQKSIVNNIYDCEIQRQRDVMLLRTLGLDDIAGRISKSINVMEKRENVK